MRADRLVAIVLLLQAHGQLTAPALASRLEVSERTIRRDLDALLLSGLPLYSQRGRGGGWALTDGYQVNLSGLTADEAQALFLATGPELLAGLGIEQGVSSALRKLLAALPKETRSHATKAHRAVHVDPTRWGQLAEETPRMLASLRAAVVAGLQVDLTYAKPGREASVRRVHPYGLVSKSGVWYLLAGTEAGPRTFRASRVADVAATAEPVERPDDFDLARAWEEVNHELPHWPDQISVEFSVEADAVPEVTGVLGPWNNVQALDPGENGSAGPRRFRARFPSVGDAAFELIYFGEAVRVLAPASVRHELARIGRNLVSAYALPPVRDRSVGIGGGAQQPAYAVPDV
ncbi:YafY family protein [Actinopolymorpha sp. B17G11]|uniref:helix-turn-helix transcriptional regulator n=1 Tax=Actinopolymorpha sp. B17G11 TaxID=3160861 RepID=UPI0032E50420